MSSILKSPIVKAVPRRLRVLLVEDSEPDALLLTRALHKGGFDCTVERVQRSDEMKKALSENQWDIVLADYAMPQFNALEALRMVKEHGLDLPFIIVSGHIEEDTAVGAMRAGAHDYVMKDRLARLLPAVERELREAEMRRSERKHSEELRRAHDELESRVEARTADLKTAKQKLEQMLQERRRLENELLEIAEMERRRIGFDLHDDLGQKLTGASMMIKGLQQRLSTEKHRCAEDAVRIQHLMEEIVAHTHDLARQFSSLRLQGEDLVAVLKGLTENVKKMFNLRCRFTSTGQPPALSPDVTLQLHKIAQEAVSNAIKHGKATSVDIQLENSPDSVALTIKNDGIPFSVPETSRSRMGLRIMNYRANTIGANLEIKPQGKNGTVVTCVLTVQEGNGSRAPRRTEPKKVLALPGNGI